MHTFTKSAASVSRGGRSVHVIAVSLLLSLGLGGTAFADTNQVDARLAIERAQANIDLVSRENPSATQDQSFASAQQKLVNAQTALAHDHNRQAEWLANEAELLADTTAATAKLAGLQRTRSDVAHDVDVLAIELHK